MNGDSSQFKRMSTHRLESILRKSLTDMSIPTEDLLIISGILERRDAEKGIESPDVEAAWDHFLERQQDLPPGSPPGVRPKKNFIQNRILQRCAIVAICVFSVASVLLTTQAFGYDPIGAIIHWTADVFHFENVGADRDGFEGTHSLDDFLIGGEMPAEFIPSWLPDGFEKTATEQFSSAGLVSVYEEYSNGEDFLLFTLSKYSSSDNAERELFEKQNPNVEKYFSGERLFYLTKNGGSGFWTAAWSDGPLVFLIRGDISKENLTKIINSLGG